MDKKLLKKIVGTMTVILMTFIVPVLVVTVTSESSIINKSKASDTDTKQGTTTKKDDSWLNKVYPILVGSIVFAWLVTILIYLGYRNKRN